MRTNNYLGSRDENRGIVLFGLVFGVLLVIVLAITFVVNSNNKEKGVSNQHALSTVVESQMCDINTFEEDNGRLIIEGELYEEVNEYIIRNLQTVELVLKDSTGDKYVYTTDYYLSTEGIEFSSIQEDEEESNIILSEIDKGKLLCIIKSKV